MKGYKANIEKLSLENENFRKVVYTSHYCQLVLMSLKPGEDIGDEVHGVDQFFRVEKGMGKLVLNGNEEQALEDGDTVVVPASMRHNIINTGAEALKLYTLYLPPHHQDGTVHATKEIAMAADEEFDGVTTE